MNRFDELILYLFEKRYTLIVRDDNGVAVKIDKVRKSMLPARVAYLQKHGISYKIDLS